MAYFVYLLLLERFTWKGQLLHGSFGLTVWQDRPTPRALAETFSSDKKWELNANCQFWLSMPSAMMLFATLVISLAILGSAEPDTDKL